MSVDTAQAETARLTSNHPVLARLLGPSTLATWRYIVRMGREDWRAEYPLSHKLNAWRHGFYAESYAVYDLEHNDPSTYVNDFAWAHRCSRLNESLYYFRHKLALRSVLMHAGVPQPETIAVVAHGRILLKPLQPDSRYVSPEELQSALLKEGGSFIVKPEAGNRGTGIFLLRVSDTGLMRQRGRSCDPFKTSDIPTAALIERLVPQGEFWNILFPDSGNSIRVLTGWTPGETQPTIIRAVQRIGTANTVPTDNWSGGGICALVDLKNGQLGPGRVNPVESKYADRHYSAHPDSNAQIEGAILPHWDRIRETVLRACTSSPLHRYVGWDVLVDNDGTPIILEGNGNSDLDLLQVHGGLLTEPAARRFYQACQVI